jgi:SH3 domain-containing YSC84-like protein 1
MNMMRKVAAVALLSFATFAWAQANDNAQGAADHTQRLQRATEIVEHMTSAAPDTGVPHKVLEGAKCVAVIPKLTKGAFVVGAEHGRGVATCRTGGGWSAPAPFEVTGISWGPQIGGKETDLLMFIMDDEGMSRLLSGHFKVGGDVSAVAGPVGRQGSAEAGWKAAVLTYSNAKGAFIGASLNGAELQQDHKATQAWYGKDATFQDILTGRVQTPNQEARAFVRAVENAKMSARSQ